MAELSRRQAQAIAPLIVASAILLLALLAYNLRNLNPGAEELPPAVVTEPPPGGVVAQDAGDALRLFFVVTVLALGAIVVVGAILLYLEGVKVWKLFSLWEFLGFGLGTLFLVLLFVQFESISQGLRSAFEQIGALADSGRSGGETSSATPNPVPGNVSFVVLWIAAAFVALSVAFFAYRFVPRSREAITRGALGEKGRRELAHAVGVAIRDLEAGGDFRAVVLRCYRAMLQLFEEHGLESLPSQTAREFEVNALRGFGVTQGSVDDLTSLFEEARYSAHEIGHEQRDGAVECLGAIRAQLEGAA